MAADSNLWIHRAKPIPVLANFVASRGTLIYCPSGQTDPFYGFGGCDSGVAPQS